jgi:hypothetical protein
MIVVILAACLLTLVFSHQAIREGLKQGVTVGKWIEIAFPLSQMIGGLLALGLLANSAIELLQRQVGHVKGASFRVGALVPFLDENRPFRINVQYVQASWFGMGPMAVGPLAPSRMGFGCISTIERGGDLFPLNFISQAIKRIVRRVWTTGATTTNDSGSGTFTKAFEIFDIT